MIAAITAILGALASFAPALIHYLTAKANNAQQLALESLRLQAAREGTALQIDLANSQAGIEQDKHVYEFASSASGNRFVDALAVFVRPYITLVMFHLWAVIKAALFVYGVNRGYDLGQLAVLIWDEPDKAIFGAIMGFWFGDRMAMRGGQRMAATLSLTTPKPSVVTVASTGGRIPAPAGDRP